MSGTSGTVGNSDRRSFGKSSKTDELALTVDGANCDRSEAEGGPPAMVTGIEVTGENSNAEYESDEVT